MVYTNILIFQKTILETHMMSVKKGNTRFNLDRLEKIKCDPTFSLDNLNWRVCIKIYYLKLLFLVRNIFW